MSLSTVGRFKQLRDLAGRESIKLCPQAASRDPFVLITETVLFWAVMGLKRDRTSKSQDPVLRALRSELLAAIKPGWLLKELDWKDSELALPNKAIEKAFSSSDELCVMDLLLPGLASDTRRYQTPAQAKLQIDPADTVEEARATPDVTQEAKADDLQLDDKQSADLIKAKVDALPQVLPTKSVRFGSIKTDGKSVFQTVLEFRTNRPKSPRSMWRAWILWCTH
ncbi:hypothetical protein BC831DRAFT_253505 [Entophlyctis helioformis]|nr:hypothetical protein BC831DRAFT_253505 [Entophlyctis helioformis]